VDPSVAASNRISEALSPEWQDLKSTAEHWANRFGIANFHPNPVWDSVCKVMNKISDSHDALWTSDYDERVAMGFYFLYCDVTGGLHTAKTLWAHNPGGRGWTSGTHRAQKARQTLDSLWGTGGTSCQQWPKIQPIWSSIRPTLMDIEAKLEKDELALIAAEEARVGQ
jgi:hypothetical protein